MSVSFLCLNRVIVVNESAGVWLFASMAISRAAMRFSVVWENPMATCEMKVGISKKKAVFRQVAAFVVCDCLRRLWCVTADFAVPICFERGDRHGRQQQSLLFICRPDPQFLRFCLGSIAIF